MTQELGLIGLGVMGRNLALNFRDHGIRVVGFDRDSSARDIFTTAGAGLAADTIEDLVRHLPAPRIVTLLVPASEAVDTVLSMLLPLLSPNDVVVDAGNSHYRDTERRTQSLSRNGILYAGVGISGGEEGARRGMSVMAGGHADALARIAPLFSAVAAHGPNGLCFARFGGAGAGHFVKMVHNGIEYADMQLIAEAAFVLRHLGGMAPVQISQIFAQWGRGPLASFLMDISSIILRKVDPDSSRPMIDVIQDAAGQKGTGHWAATAALELGVPAPTIAEAVHARCLSALKPERVLAAQGHPLIPLESSERNDPAPMVHDALVGGKICAYAQGFAIIAAAGQAFGWNIDLSEVARVWTAGCIIRADLLQDVQAAYVNGPLLQPNLVRTVPFTTMLHTAELNWRRLVATAIGVGLSIPATASALIYYDGYRTDRLWADLIQAQRDYFGAHGYQRTDVPGTFHSQWATLP